MIINNNILSYKTLLAVVFTFQLHGLSLAYAEEQEPNTSPEIVPDSISDIYSDVDMRVRLATKPNAAPCEVESCSLYQAFDARVQQLGAQLTATAYTVYPTIKKRVPQFVFSVIDKKDMGTASNGAGKVVIFRGLQQLELSDDALSFILAREMGHVIGKHHTKNTSTKLIISALASIAFPALAVISASSAAAQATTATTLLTSAASTATSMVGSEVALAKMKPSQLVESDEVALKLLTNQEWDMHSAASVLQFDDVGTNGWTLDLQVSQQYLQHLADKDNAAIEPIGDDVAIEDLMFDLTIQQSIAPLIEKNLEAKIAE